MWGCSEAAADLALAMYFSSCKGISDPLGHINPGIITLDFYE